MNLTKKRGGIIAAVVLAVGVTAATTGTAFAESGHAGKSAAAASETKAGKDKGKTNAKDRIEDKTGLRARAAFLRGAHGDRVVKGKDGAWVTREWQVGKVTAVSGQSVTVVSDDGVSWTWTADTATKVRTDGKKADLASVKAGDEVLVAGAKAGSANDAKVIVDPGAAQIQKWEQAAKDAQAKRAAKKPAISPTAAPTATETK